MVLLDETGQFGVPFQLCRNSGTPHSKTGNPVRSASSGNRNVIGFFLGMQYGDFKKIIFGFHFDSDN
jgi:hypothetical protein